MKFLSGALAGSVIGAIAGVVVIGLMGMLSGLHTLVEHADRLSDATGGLLAGFVIFAYQVGIPLGAPLGAVLGAVVGGARGARTPARFEPPPDRRAKWTVAAGIVIVAAAISAMLVVPLVGSIVNRRRELAETRARGDRIEREVLRLGGRPFSEPGLSRMVDLDNANVDDDDLIALSKRDDFRVVDRIQLSNTRISDTFVKTLKWGDFALQSLDVSGTQVTDESLAHLVRIGLPLNWFSFARTRVTDAGLDLIPDGTRINQADFRGANVTEAGVRKLFARTRVGDRIDYGDPAAPKCLSRGNVANNTWTPEKPQSP